MYTRTDSTNIRWRGMYMGGKGHNSVKHIEYLICILTLSTTKQPKIKTKNSTFLLLNLASVNATEL